LQQHDFRLVYEALHERQLLLENAPHLVVPLPFLIPLFGRDGVVNKAVSRTYSTALWMYDLTGGWRIGKRHKRIGREQALAHLPTLKAEHLVAAFIYYDARSDDARLTLTVMRTAAVNHGAVAVNYAEVTGLLHNGAGRASGARVRAWIPGSAHETSGTGSGRGEREIEVRASVVVNATGVWADDLRALDEAAHPHSLRPAKGVHLTVSRSRLPTDIAAVIPARSDRRQIFVVPWADGDDVYLGTTDTDWDGPLDDPACMPEDVDYILQAANGSTTSALGRADVTGVWAGLRPLLDPGDKHVSARTKDLSRRHTVHTSEHGVVTVTGGKLTTYRRMAEQTVDAAAKVLGKPGVGPSRTRHLRLIGAPGGASELSAMTGPRAADRLGISTDQLQALVHRHGTETADVLDLASHRSELLQPLVEGLPYLKAEAVFAAREEMALTVDDIMSRRTRSVLRRAEATKSAADGVAEMLAAETGRDPVGVLAETQAFKGRVARDMRRAGLGESASDPAERDVEQGAR
ncbi:MAG TPA: glycerol-3-phosphate dehydrogenase/oxidase, partial [Acidimicrobiales bacterium]|nr:glycerol-3-phosphate dehydrogenase/oxidase [Acidimicrobiales bacterium]